MVHIHHGLVQGPSPFFFLSISYLLPISILLPFTGTRSNSLVIHLGHSYKMYAFKKSIHRLLIYIQHYALVLLVL